MGTYVLLLAYLVALILRPQEYIPALQGAPILVTLLSVAGATWLFFQSRKRIFSAETVFAVGLSFAIAISVAATGWWSQGIVEFADFIPTVVLFILICTVVNTPGRFKAFFVCLCICTAIVAAHGIDQSVSGIGWTGAAVVQGDRSTYIGILGDPNDLGMLFALCLPLAATLAFGKNGILVRLIGLSTLCLIAYGLILTNSRGAGVAIAAVLLTMTLVSGKLSKGMFLLTILAAAFIALAPSRVSDLNYDEDSANSRVESWYQGLQMLRANPVFGVGKDHYLDYHHLTAHNSFVLAFSELGILGYFFWASLITLAAYMLLKLHRFGKSKAKESSAVVNPTLAAHIALNRPLMLSFVAMVVAATFLSRTYTALIFVTLGMVIANYRCAEVLAGAELRLEVLKNLRWFIAISLSSIMFFWLMTRTILLL